MLIHPRHEVNCDMLDGVRCNDIRLYHTIFGIRRKYYYGWWRSKWQRQSPTPTPRSSVASWKLVAATLFPVGVVGVFVTQCVFQVQGHPSRTAIDGEAYHYRTLLLGCEEGGEDRRRLDEARLGGRWAEVSMERVPKERAALN